MNTHKKLSVRAQICYFTQTHVDYNKLPGKMTIAMWWPGKQNKFCTVWGSEHWGRCSNGAVLDSRLSHEAQMLVTKWKKKFYRCFGKFELKDLSPYWFLTSIKHKSNVRWGILRLVVASEEQVWLHRGHLEEGTDHRRRHGPWAAQTVSLCVYKIF